MGDVPYIWWRGKRMTSAVRDAILAAEQRAGFTFTITQGGFNAGGVAASADTHDGDAVDFRVLGLSRAQVERMVEALRWAGFAAWLRTTSVPLYGVRAQGFSVAHVHAVPNGWGRPSAGARRQATSYRNGRDGLARNLADIGPGHVGTWRNQTSPRTIANIDTRTDIERLIDNMDQKTLEGIIYTKTAEAERDSRAETVRQVVEALKPVIEAAAYTKTAQVLRDREKRDKGLAYLAGAEVQRDARAATVDAIIKRAQEELGSLGDEQGEG